MHRTDLKAMKGRFWRRTDGGPVAGAPCALALRERGPVYIADIFVKK